jgi:hypothetical protein
MYSAWSYNIFRVGLVPAKVSIGEVLPGNPKIPAANSAALSLNPRLPNTSVNKSPFNVSNDTTPPIPLVVNFFRASSASSLDKGIPSNMLFFFLFYSINFFKKINFLL